MLSSEHRLRRSTDFQQVVRRGKRASAGALVLHAGPRTTGPARVGLVVSNAVGNAVTRNQVKRRLRELSRHHLDALHGRSVVIRATPEAAEADFWQLSADLDRCLSAMERSRR